MESRLESLDFDKPYWKASLDPPHAPVIHNVVGLPISGHFSAHEVGPICKRKYSPQGRTGHIRPSTLSCTGETSRKVAGMNDTFQVKYSSPRQFAESAFGRVVSPARRPQNVNSASVRIERIARHIPASTVCRRSNDCGWQKVAGSYPATRKGPQLNSRAMLRAIRMRS
jgi:hypothetical protein